MASLLAARLCRASSSKLVIVKQIGRNNLVVRNYAEEAKDALSRAARRKTLKERAMEPTSGAPFAIGTGAVAGGSLLGIGALCYYGLGMSKDVGAFEKSTIWPQYVKDRIKTTYLYFGSSVALTAASAVAAFRSPMIMRLATMNGVMGLAVCLGAMMGSGILCQSMEYKPGIGAKQLAWMFHTGVMGCMLAPMCMLGGPLLIRAAWYTAGVVGGLSAIAVCAPSERFLNMGGPLAMGLGVVFVSSIGTMFLPPTTALGAGLYSISLYGGLLLFSAFLLYDTQRIIAQAEQYPTSPGMYGVRPYDPINASLSIYMDTINIFIRIATILAGGGGQRRK